VNLSDFANGDNAALRDIIAGRIRQEGSISFADFYRLALYHPTYGYYVCCDPTDDYHSSPNTHGVFGAAIARQVADFWRLMDRPSRFDVFEAGAGSGRLAADVLRALRIETPELYNSVRYVTQDVTGLDAFPRLERAGVPLDKVTIAAGLPPRPSIEGCVLSNELLDALPFERVRLCEGRLKLLRVGLEDGRFVDVEAGATPELEAYFAGLGFLPGEGCEAEVGLEAVEWTQRAATALRRGYVLTLDYGYEASALYAPWRKRGTLLTFYRHTSGDDPYQRVGRQDITASVDFTSVIKAGEAAGLKTLGLATQSDFLTALGIAEALQQTPAASEMEAYFALRRGVMELIDSSGLGRIRALIQAKGVSDTTPRGLGGASRG
jgi:SAM-dependent MidA family methyltransferase